MKAHYNMYVAIGVIIILRLHHVLGAQDYRIAAGSYGFFVLMPGVFLYIFSNLFLIDSAFGKFAVVIVKN